MRWKNMPLGRVGVLVGVEDVAAVAVDEVGGGGHEPLLVAAPDEEDGVIVVLRRHGAMIWEAERQAPAGR